ncbi:Daunorubicin/doxorubicin resistance ATP-binding protein DrrA [Streptomyces sp. ADI96-02]|uniref:ATP-binding cassette domain-containing protein n=1 Tax=Streptomyces sp. ADI96-02 TaxID=1522760 RepID=UPI000FA39D23|nr:ATP-binding cassette domain-containing protein [Streptomyces sp. ADI96-02]RPK60600.1 Daunorubicin/doxorubicin resistance ATP-binding protein DrrA [Streptomyces sp. ADI96-02]
MTGTAPGMTGTAPGTAETARDPAETARRAAAGHAPDPAGAGTARPEVVIETRGLTKRYRGGHLAVDGLDLSVPAGSVFGFLGPNGSGKTTTIRMLMGLIDPTSGSARVLGHPMPQGARTVLPQVGALIEGPALYGFLSGRDNLLRYDRADPTADPRTRRARVGHALERVGLAAASSRKAKAYSLGMKQRLGLAAALLRPRALLVLDEPTNGLDPQGMREIRALVRELATEGPGVRAERADRPGAPADRSGTRPERSRARGRCGRSAFCARRSPRCCAATGRGPSSASWPRFRCSSGSRSASRPAADRRTERAGPGSRPRTSRPEEAGGTRIACRTRLEQTGERPSMPSAGRAVPRSARRGTNGTNGADSGNDTTRYVPFPPAYCSAFGDDLSTTIGWNTPMLTE